MKNVLIEWFKKFYVGYKLIDEQNTDKTTEELLIEIENDYFSDNESDSYKYYGDDVISYFKTNLLNDKNSSISLIKEENDEQA